ncbi:MAG: hypothetical protein R6V49_07205 [Bacteroidales bacterium]
MRIKNITKRVILPGVIVLAGIFGLMTGCTGNKPFADNTPPDRFSYVSDTTGMPFEIHFQRGQYHNHPLMVFWIEDLEGNYVKTIYIAQSIGKGIFRYGAKDEGHWEPGEIQRPASLPYWAHKRGVKNDLGNYIPSPKMPMPDAVTGPTPKRNFILKFNTGKVVSDQFVLKMEINQTWDFNEYWTNGKFPGNQEYITSCQPALVYEARINMTDGVQEYIMKAVGHSHYDGSDGSLTTDLSTITTALDIAREVKVVFP